jgi:hypothetical protein
MRVGGEVNEMGQIWSLSRFPHALCWHEEGIVRMWCRLSNEGMHVPDRVSWSFCTCEPIDRLVKMLLSELIGGGRIRVLSLLGFNNLFLN